MILDNSLTETEMDVSEFEALTYDKLPQLFLGFVIKNKFDIKNLVTTEHTIKVGHICASDGTLQSMFFRGIFVEPTKNFKSVINEVQNYNSVDVNAIYSKYSKLLSKHDLTCNNTYAYLMDGLYPVDIIHLPYVVDGDQGYEDYMSSILEEDAVSWFFRPELKCFVLTKCNTYIFKNT